MTAWLGRLVRFCVGFTIDVLLLWALMWALKSPVEGLEWWRIMIGGLVLWALGYSLGAKIHSPNNKVSDELAEKKGGCE